MGGDVSGWVGTVPAWLVGGDGSLFVMWLGGLVLGGRGVVLASGAVKVFCHARSILISWLNAALRYAGMVGHKLMGLVAGVGAGLGSGAHKLVGGAGAANGVGAGAGSGAGVKARDSHEQAPHSASSAPTSAVMPMLVVASCLVMVVCLGLVVVLVQLGGGVADSSWLVAGLLRLVLRGWVMCVLIGLGVAWALGVGGMVGVQGV